MCAAVRQGKPEQLFLALYDEHNPFEWFRGLRELNKKAIPVMDMAFAGFCTDSDPHFLLLRALMVSITPIGIIHIKT